jgi:hypothetical protein
MVAAHVVAPCSSSARRSAKSPTSSAASAAELRAADDRMVAGARGSSGRLRFDARNLPQRDPGADRQLDDALAANIRGVDEPALYRYQLGHRSDTAATRRALRPAGNSFGPRRAGI